MIFDSHAHYDDEAFSEDRDLLLSAMGEQQISYIVNVGANIASSKTTLELADQYPNLYAAIGIHPQEAASCSEDAMRWLKDNSSHDKVRAIGEIGLDYYWGEPDKEVQQDCFVGQLDLAKAVKLPIIIHSRDAAQDTLRILKENKTADLDAVIHCYSYSRETASEFLAMGCYFGIGGVITFANAKKLKEAVAFLPMDKILIETDCPYLAPVPNRGKRNSSLNLPFVAREIASLKGISEEQVMEITLMNAKRFYNISE